MQKINFPIFSNTIKKKYSKNTLSLSNILSRTNTKKGDLKGRKFKQGITIDDISSRDLDDGIWAYKHDYGYVVEVSIADVAEIIQFNSPLDLEALERSTSVYYNTHALFMLPDDITINKLSLNHNITRLSLTVTINLDLEFNVIDTFIEETLFHNIKRFCYKSFSKDYYDVDSQFNEALTTIHKIAIGLYSNRYNKIIIDDFKDDDRKILLNIKQNDLIDGKRVVVNDNDELELQDIEIDDKKIPSFCIQEFMILANKEVARYCIEHKIPIPFRNHMSDYIGKDKMPLQMDRAYYSEKMLGHFALGEEAYCHFTSPIRRYADLVLHRQLKYFLRTGKKFYSVVNMRELCNYITKKVHSIIDLQISEEKEIVEKQNDRLFNKLSKDITSEDITKLKFSSFEKLLKKFLFLKTGNIELPDELVSATHQYLIDKKSFSDDLLVRMFFTKNNLSMDYLFGYINTKYPTYIIDFMEKRFKRGVFSFRYKISKTKTSHLNSYAPTGSDKFESNFVKMYKQNKRSSNSYKKPIRYQVTLELFFKGESVLKQTATSSDKKGVEIRAYSKFFRKIVTYYRKSDINIIDYLIKAWFFNQAFLNF